MKPWLGHKPNYARRGIGEPVGHWIMNEGAGGLVLDVSGNRNDGTLVNMASPGTPTSGWTQGHFGDALAFDGLNDNLKMKSDGLTENFAVSIWMKSSSVLAFDGLVGDYDFSEGDEGWQIRFAAGPIFGFSVGGAGGFLNGNFGGSNIDDDVLHHLVAVVNSAGTSIDGYQDGEKLTPIDISAKPIASSGLSLRVGSGSTNLDVARDYYTGLIEAVSIYGTSLTADQAQGLYADPFLEWATPFVPFVIPASSSSSSSSESSSSESSSSSSSESVSSSSSSSSESSSSTSSSSGIELLRKYSAFFLGDRYPVYNLDDRYPAQAA